MKGHTSDFTAANESHLIAACVSRDPAAKRQLIVRERMRYIIGGALFLSFWALYSQATHPPEPITFLSETDTAQTLLPVTTMTAPFNTLPILSTWVRDAVIQSFTLDFSEYEEQMADARKNFTSEGWVGFQDALNNDDILDQVLSQKMRVNAVATGPAILSDLHNNDIEWDFEIPITLTFSIGQTTNSVSHLVKVVVRRVNPDVNPMGRGIYSIKF